MKRLHVHISVDNLETAIGFYSALFGATPVKQKADYAKWMLDDPRVNFAISARGAKPGLDHLGIQVDSPEELATMRENMKRADLSLFDEGEATCCYAKSDKSWLQDPSGIAWETYRTMEDAAFFHESSHDTGSACCAPGNQAPVQIESKVPWLSESDRHILQQARRTDSDEASIGTQLPTMPWRVPGCAEGPVDQCNNRHSDL